MIRIVFFAIAILLRRNRARAGLSEPSDPHGRAVAARPGDRPRRPADGAENVGVPRPADRGGQPAGAGGTIGTDNAAKSPPDGYTILAASSGPATVSPLLQKLPYDVEKHLTPVHLVGMSPYLLVAHPSFPAANAKEFIDLIRANPGKYTFASSGTGATAHLIAEWFNSLARLKALHVPYKGSAQALTDLMPGRSPTASRRSPAPVRTCARGKLKTYGVSLEKGSPLAPGIPPLAQAASMPGFDVGAWLGLMVPAGTPQEIVTRLATEADKALQTAEVRERLAGIGIEMISKGPEEFATYLKGETARFAAIIKNGNIKLEQ